MRSARCPHDVCAECSQRKNLFSILNNSLNWLLTMIRVSVAFCRSRRWQGGLIRGVSIIYALQARSNLWSWFQSCKGVYVSVSVSSFVCMSIRPTVFSLPTSSTLPPPSLSNLYFLLSSDFPQEFSLSSTRCHATRRLSTLHSRCALLKGGIAAMVSHGSSAWL